MTNKLIEQDTGNILISVITIRSPCLLACSIDLNGSRALSATKNFMNFHRGTAFFIVSHLNHKNVENRQTFSSYHSGECKPQQMYKKLWFRLIIESMPESIPLNRSKNFSQ